MRKGGREVARPAAAEGHRDALRRRPQAAVGDPAHDVVGRRAGLLRRRLHRRLHQAIRVQWARGDLISKGAARYDVRKIFGLFDHLTPRPNLELIYSIKFMQPPFLRTLFHDPLPPSDADIIFERSLIRRASSCGRHEGYSFSLRPPMGYANVSKKRWKRSFGNRLDLIKFMSCSL